MATNYHQLGMVFQHRGALGDAETWYRKSLEINEALGNWPGMAKTYGQLGLLAEARGDGAAALQWMIRCITLFDKLTPPPARRRATSPGSRAHMGGRRSAPPGEP